MVVTQSFVRLVGELMRAQAVTSRNDSPMLLLTWIGIGIRLTEMLVFVVVARLHLTDEFSMQRGCLK